MIGYELFVMKLEKLSPAVLALLRRSTGLPLSESVAAFDLFTDMYWPLRERHPGLSRSACWRVATLYPWHPQPRGRGDLGLCLARIAPRAYRDADQRQQQRDRRHLEGLLAADHTTLDAALCEAVGRLARCQVPIDWRQLAEDLAAWRLPARPTQTKWATSYYHFTLGDLDARRNPRTPEPCAVEPQSR